MKVCTPSEWRQRKAMGEIAYDMLSIELLYEQFCDYLGLSIWQDLTKKHFPRFQPFLDESYPEEIPPGSAFGLWDVFVECGSIGR